MKRFSFVPIGFILLALVVYFVLPLRAASLVSNSVNADSFPLIRFQLSEPSAFSARQIDVLENGTVNSNPLVVLPSRVPLTKVDLFVILERANASDYDAQLIRHQLKSIFPSFQKQGFNLQLYFHSYSSGDTKNNFGFQLYTDPILFSNAVDQLSFSEADYEGNFLLDKLYHLTTLSVRTDAQPIALVVNPSRFLSSDFVDQTTYSISAVVSKLTDHSFWLFSMGDPSSALAGAKNTEVEDTSLHHLLPGGYLGTLFYPLPHWVDLLTHVSSDAHTIQLISNAKPANGGSTSIEILLRGNSSAQFSLPVPSAQPNFLHTAAELDLNQPQQLLVDVEGSPVLTSMVELVYLNSVNQFIRQPLFLDDLSNDLWTASTLSLSDSNPPASLFYYFDWYSPFDRQTQITGEHVISVIAVDSGIHLTSQSLNGTSVRWMWSGETVDLSNQFEIWMGDTRLAETKQRYFDIPITDCERYQQVRVRAYLPSGASHPRAGDWSLFSRAVGHFEPPIDGNPSPTEADFLSLMQRCAPDALRSNFSNFSSQAPDYQSGQLLTVPKVLYYTLLSIYDFNSPYLSDSELRQVFVGAGYASLSDFEGNTVLSSQALMYKMLGQLLHSDHLFAPFLSSLQALDLIRNGDPSV